MSEVLADKVSTKHTKPTSTVTSDKTSTIDKILLSDILNTDNPTDNPKKNYSLDPYHMQLMPAKLTDNDDLLLKILDQTEKADNPKDMQVVDNSNTMTNMTVNNAMQSLPALLPNMNFNNSTVTINYNFK